jgi:Protein of unknown function (DUF2970)
VDGSAGESQVLAKRYASPLRVAKAVLWSFVGIRKRAAHEQDSLTLHPVHVVLAGIIGAALFVAVLVVLIKFVVLAK